MPQGFATTCKSGYARYQPTTMKYMCDIAPGTNGTPPNTCHLGSSCAANDNSGYTKPCACGYTAEGSSFCPYFEGDSPLQYAIGNFTKLIAMDNSNKFTSSCGTYSRFTEYCYADENGIVQPYFNFALNFLMYRDGVQLKNNPDCVTKVYERVYYEEE